jgi:hypothetical protein
MSPPPPLPVDTARHRLQPAI